MAICRYARISDHQRGNVQMPKRRSPRLPRAVARSLIAIALLGLGYFGGPLVMTRGTEASAGEITGCRVTDGDTIRCGDERIRLLGIDAPELPGHCRQGRVCARGDPYASTHWLEQAVSSSMSITRIKSDRYGRTIAMVSGPKGDLSCWQLAHGAAIYKAKWDDERRVAGACPQAIL